MCAAAAVFKFSSTPSNNGGLVKSGLHWGENSVRPYPIGVTTASGEAARMVISRFVGLARTGRKPLYNCTTNSAYRPCALIRDDNSLHIVQVNDGVITATSGAGKPQGLMVGIDLRPIIADWGIQVGSLGAFLTTRFASSIFLV